MERLCCILDTDENYAVRLTACFNNRKALPFSVRAFSDIDAFRACAIENDIRILIVEDCLYPEIKDSSAGLVIRLCEQPVLTGNEADGACIAKYQASDNIIRDVVSLYGDEGRASSSSSEGGEAKLICIYSPNGYCGKTTLAMALAHIMGQKKRVLYLNLEEFSASGEVLAERKGTLSDALFYYYSSSGQGMGKMMSVISQGNCYDYIPPAVCAEDLPHLTTDSIIGLTDRIVCGGSYDVVIVDMGSLIKEPWKLLKRADAILCPRPDSPHRERRYMEFEKYLHCREMDDVADRIILVDIIQDEWIAKEGKLDYPHLPGTAYGRMVSSLNV